MQRLSSPADQPRACHGRRHHGGAARRGADDVPPRATGEYSLCSEEEVGAHVRTLYRWHGSGMAQPLERAAWRGISGGVCRDDEGLDNFGGGADGDGREAGEGGGGCCRSGCCCFVRARGRSREEKVTLPE